MIDSWDREKEEAPDAAFLYAQRAARTARRSRARRARRQMHGRSDCGAMMKHSVHAFSIMAWHDADGSGPSCSALRLKKYLAFVEIP